MKKLIIADKWEYEIIKNEGRGMEGYGYNVKIYKNDIEVSRQSAFAYISQAQQYARDYLLMYEFNIERDNE